MVVTSVRRLMGSEESPGPAATCRAAGLCYYSYAVPMPCGKGGRKKGSQLLLNIYSMTGMPLRNKDFYVQGTRRKLRLRQAQS
jgi:hypothetical protein